MTIPPIRRRRWPWWCLGGVSVAVLVFCFGVPPMVERLMNRVGPPVGAPVPAAAHALHQQLRVADLHADPLLWGRNLLHRSSRGHVDVPRLIEGRVAVQVFSVVSKSPRGLNIERNDDDSDSITLLAMAQRWPPVSWFSLRQRALYQAGRLTRMAAESDGALVVVRNREDLQAFLADHAGDPQRVAGILALEGAQVLEGDPAAVDPMFAAGYRMMSPTHFFDTEMAGSAHGVEKGGLTAAGRQMLARMASLGMIVDLAHAAPATVDQVLALAQRPVVVSHTGVRGTCDNRRNLTDAQLDAIAANGGLVGIGFWPTAVCGEDAAAIARAIRYTADRIGLHHVALGSDFDGAVTTPFDATGLPRLTAALQAEGFDAGAIARIMGENQIDFLLQNLPTAVTP